MMLVEKFREWYLRAGRGAKRIYYIGHLAIDRGPGSMDSKSAAQREVSFLADHVRGLYEKGLVGLWQRRMAEDCYVYGAVKR